MASTLFSLDTVEYSPFYRQSQMDEIRKNAYRIDSLDSWRTQYLASQHADSDALKTSLLALPEDSRFTTSLAISNDSPLIAIGSGSYETNLFFVDANPSKEMKVKAFFASKFPIYSLSFQSDMLITGTERSAAVLYQVSSNKLISSDEISKDSHSEPLVRCIGTYKNKAARSIEAAAAGNHIPSRRVHCVSFAPKFNSIQKNEGSTDPNEDLWPPSSISDTPVFFSCLGGTLNIWDANNNNQALRIEKICTQPVFSAEWSPHSPHSQIAAGSVDGIISILDLRKKGRGVAWRTHYDNGNIGINDISWNPFVPYWIASGGDDGIVNIWDLRFTTAGKPAAVVGANQIHSAVTKVCWSRSHVDLISTGCADRHWRLHNLRSDTSTEVQKVDSSVVADGIGAEDIGAIVGLVNGPENSNMYYSLSDCGDLCSYKITDKLLANIAPHRINKDIYPREYKSESDIYARNFSSGSSAVVEFVNSLVTNNGTQIQGIMESSDQVRQLCELFKAKAEITSENWKIPPIQQQQVGTPDESNGYQISSSAEITEKFVSKLRTLEYGLPPGYSLEELAAKDPEIMKALESLNMTNLRVKLQDIVDEFRELENSTADGDEAEEKREQICSRLLDRESQLYMYLEQQPKLFDANLLKDVAKIVLSHDCLRGLSLGEKIFEIYVKLSKKNLVECESLSGLVHVLLAPTIFDPDQGESNDNTPGNLDIGEIRSRIGGYLVCNPSVVLEMVRLEIKVQDTVLKGGDQVKVANKIIDHMNEHSASIKTLLMKYPSIHKFPLFDEIRPEYPSTITLSAAATRLYLNALIQMRSYDEYLANVKFWLPPNKSGLVGYPLTNVLSRQCYEVVVPRFKRQLDIVVNTVNREPLGLEPRIYRDVILKIANTLVRCDLETNEQENSSPITLNLSFNQMQTYFLAIYPAFGSVLQALAQHSSESKLRAGREASPLVTALESLTKKYKSKQIQACIDLLKPFITK
ncbi:hypothetical protein BB559_002749 [Furculomyces boomerangus]|uniref:Uncharacterized protein n=2 Tax=Harpellales TaxID=61421 RepID=A0A2T9YSZ6_9FUNG|nr:hypothetical protein BB559_002749 [Furculomyces boomerangus]PVZ97331.1 hypothetical protein BB558_006696 [Smittium angustum]PVZ99175.1 hypothetical protein BB558_004817 [Smittium angustum]